MNGAENRKQLPLVAASGKLIIDVGEKKEEEKMTRGF